MHLGVATRVGAPPALRAVAAGAGPAPLESLPRSTLRSSPRVARAFPRWSSELPRS